MIFAIFPLFQYGMEESLGIHVILSNIFWWASFILVISAYNYRDKWNIGEIPWTFLFLTFFFFGARELGHLIPSLFYGVIRYIFGIFSGIFMTSALILIYIKIYKRKSISVSIGLFPFILALVFLILFLWLYFSGTSLETMQNNFFDIENIVWIAGSLISIYTTFMLGTKSTGGFVNVFLFFHLASIIALLWKFLGLIGEISCPLPYAIREILETMFGMGAITSVYILRKMLKDLSRRLL